MAMVASAAISSFPAIVAIGHLAGWENQGHQGEHLSQPDEAQRKRRPGPFIQLPAHRHRQHALTEHREDVTAQVAAEPARAEREIGVVAHRDVSG